MERIIKLNLFLFSMIILAALVGASKVPNPKGQVVSNIKDHREAAFAGVASGRNIIAQVVGATPSPRSLDDKLKYLGVFKITSYCICEKCCNKPNYEATKGITATGHKITPADYGKLIAVDPKVIKLKSKVFIEGVGWCIALDTGGVIKGKRIDLLMKTHSEALRFGVRRLEIWKEKK